MIRRRVALASLIALSAVVSSCTESARGVAPSASTSGCSVRPEEGCPCREGASESCFLTDRQLPDAQVMCTEGERVCRRGAWSSCEHPHSYIAQVASSTQQIVDSSGGLPNCSICDVLCYKVIDNLLADGGTAGGTVQFADGGGVTIKPYDATGDAGPLSDCALLNSCCATQSGAAATSCMSFSSAGNQATCHGQLQNYCPSDVISGPKTGCTLGSGPDTDCDGIPNEFDNQNGPPFSDTNIQTIFHKLGPGESGLNTLDVSYKLNNADVYVLFDSTGTMEPERATLTSLLTTGSFADCAQLDQCCGGDTTCQALVSANNSTNCYNAQLTYCGAHVDCADTDFDGNPNNELKTQGVVGGIRCVVGTAWFGLGQFREVPVHREPEQDPCLAEGCRYGDRDEHLFTQLVDMTPDHTKVAAALASITMNYNWDEPEGGWLALNSVLTGRGHYFGMNRPAVPDRSHGEGCPAGTFGYPCFRSDAIPIVVIFTDAPHHNGPGTMATDSTNCYGRGAGCPYADLSTLNTYSGTATDSASDGIAHFVPTSSENATSAIDLGAIENAYLTVVGDTTHMTADYSGSAVGCGAADTAPDALVRFEVGSHGGSGLDVNFHLTKNDAYDDSLYGQWTPWALTPGTDDPTPGTQFGSVVSVFRGTPDDLGGAGTMLQCVSDAQPATLHGSNWDQRSVDFNVHLDDNRTYYVSIKGVRATDHGGFQLQLGETSARIATTYQAPTWSQTRAALVSTGVRVLPVLATAGFSNNFVTTAQAQAKLVAEVSGAVRADGTPIWHEIGTNGADTGKAIVTSVAELAQQLAMNVTLSAIDGPDPGASLFSMSVTPQSSAGCLQPHPLVAADGTCSGSGPTYDCNTQYTCRPGAIPKFKVAFTNPAAAPVPPNPSNPYGGYLFKLQLKGNSKYLLSEIPVFLIPEAQVAPPPTLVYASAGVYEQQISDLGCKRDSTFDGGTTPGLESSMLPSWSDLYFDADVPDGTSIDFELCTADTAAALDDCQWRADGSSRPKVTVSGQGSCSADADCLGNATFGNGLCTNGTCRFINAPKVFPDITCVDDTKCPNGPLGAGDYVIRSRCETNAGSPGFGRCIALSAPADMGATLLSADDGRAYAKVRITLNSNTLMSESPTLYDWYLTYDCHSAL